MTTRAVARRRQQQGLSLIELMVGITIGLIVVAGASVLVASQLSDNRLLIAEAQVQQDLRATSDIITRELRRAGMNNRFEQSVWDPASTAHALPNTYSGDDTLSPAAGITDDEVAFAYRENENATVVTGPLGFRLNTVTGAIESLQRSGTWQELTDRNTLNVTEFAVTQLVGSRSMAPCLQPCPDGTTGCWPRVGSRAFRIVITATSRAVPRVVRRHQAIVRLRNDDVPFSDPVSPRMCPA
jgi:prepilin-type N-terminal cleavage/methylation domain-containing protein